jgi:tryptophanyl-tRNA synthetase
MTSAKPVVFSGIQPTGTIHIGNYYGAVRRWAAEQDQFFNIFCLVDLHAITLPQDPAVLREKILETGAILLAAGIDPKRSALFVQSDLPEHAELAWLLNCIASMGQLNRMTQYKEKSGSLRDKVGVGVFTYPLLMAADILLYRTNYVPVGADQKQHVELTRDLAQRFNATYGETFVLPEPRIPTVGARIMGLDDPTKKMSKSGAEASYVALTDPPDAVRKKLARATTDSQRTIVFDESRPGIYNLLTIYEALGSESRQQIEAEFAGKGYKEFKAALADRIIATLEPIQRRYQALAADPAELERMLVRGADRVRPMAEATLADVKRRVGLA